MVIFYSYVSLPEGICSSSMKVYAIVDIPYDILSKADPPLTPLCFGMDPPM